MDGRNGREEEKGEREREEVGQQGPLCMIQIFFLVLESQPLRRQASRRAGKQSDRKEGEAREGGKEGEASVQVSR